MILVWGLPRDPPTAAVTAALRRLDADVRFLDQRVAAAGDCNMSMDGQLRLSLSRREDDLDLRTCRAAYVRPYDVRELPAVRRAPSGSPDWQRALRVDQMLADWADLTDALVVNRPAAMASNASKPFQARQLRDAGFAVPDTIITTDPEAVLAFRERHQRVVYKSISGVRSIVAELTEARLQRIDDVRWCPTQFQELVPGTDHRVHVVDGEVFGAAVESDGIDYRYATTATVSEAQLPDEVAERCVTVTRAMGLLFSGIDLRRTPTGRWYCFEVNPSPGFTYYQSATGQPIAEAVARLLADED